MKKSVLFVLGFGFMLLLFLKSINVPSFDELLSENVEALVRETGEVVVINGVSWYEQYVDVFDESGQSPIEGPSYYFSQVDYPPTPVPKSGNEYYSECGNLVHVTIRQTTIICYGRLLKF